MTLRDHFKAAWRNAGFNPKLMASATIAPPPPTGFVRAYHLLPEAYGISNLRNQRLKVTRISEANDPFELLALHFGEQRTRKAARAFRKDRDSSTGMLCFSRNWKDPVLWSHYADKHKGLCLGFDLKHGVYQEVRYADKRLREALGEGKDPLAISKTLQALLLCTKSNHWKYEEELRIVVKLAEAIEEKGIHFWNFDNDMCLREVILGDRCPLSLQASIERLTKHADPEVYVSKARLAFRSFEVVADGKHLSSRIK